MKNYLKIIKIDKDSLEPLYHQLANAIVNGIESGAIAKDDILPSIRDFCYALDISKKTVELAYNTLKKRGIVSSVKCKGYFIACDEMEKELSGWKKDHAIL